MAGSAKKKKKKSRKAKNEGTDRLSSLDDSLLLSILSLLETLDAVRTCVLSKRWRDLWMSIPVLRAQWMDVRVARYFREKDVSASEFVNQFLLCRDNCDLHELILFADRSWDIHVAEAAVQYAVKHGVQEMFLHFGNRYSYEDEEFEFPRCFTQCQSLRKLELVFNHSQFTHLPKKMGLTALTSLRLDDIVFSKDNFDGSLFSGSPNLQTLHLLNFYCERLVTFDIHAPSLRTLKLDFCDEYLDPDGCKIVIIAPKLTMFRFTGPIPMACSVDASSLEDVYIDLFKPEEISNGEAEEVKDLVLCSIKLVNEFRVARCMTMTPTTIKFISALPTLLDEHLSKFENLDHLIIKTPMAREFVLPPCILKYFLNSTMTLEVCRGEWKTLTYNNTLSF